MEGYERGEEKREEVRAEVEKMKSYLNKEKEYSAGSWIKNVSSFSRLPCHCPVARYLERIGIWTGRVSS